MSEVKKVSAAEYFQSTPTISLNPLQETVTEDVHCSPVHPFPIDLFPQWLQKTIRDHSASYRTPGELWACAFLSGISAASGKRFKLITGNYTNYPQLWLMVVGSSGTGKSEAFRVAFKRLNEIDNKTFVKNQIDYQDWEALGKQGAPPRWAQMCIGDTTPEALYTALSHSPNGLTLYRDELSGWFKDIGRYNQSGEIGHYLSIFDNNQFTINRKGDRPQLITEPFLNIFGTIQPGVLQDVLSRNGAEESGFAQRFLYLYPDFPIREYEKAGKTSDLTQYNNLIDSILRIDQTGETVLSHEAEDVYSLFYNEMERERSQANDFWAAVYSKAQIQVLRLALTVKIARLPEVPTDQVEKEDMECAIGMQHYFIHSIRRFKENDRIRWEKSDLIKAIYTENPEASQRTVAAAVGVSQPYVNKVIRLSVITSGKPNMGAGRVLNSMITEGEDDP